MSQTRLPYGDIAPAARKAVLQVEGYIQSCGLDKKLIELLKLRASQINGCAFCIDMHARLARKLGESQQRLDLLEVWRETTLFNDREQAALAWIEALTRLPDAGAPQALFDALGPHFSEKEIVDLTVLAGLINLWNRLGVGFQLEIAQG
jgi:AhpD family alkylhydroperoxidase